MTPKQQKQFALALLDYHGGMHSGLYAIGSVMLSTSMRGVSYVPGQWYGHNDAIVRAYNELRAHAKIARTAKWYGYARDARQCDNLCARLMRTYADCFNVSEETRSQEEN